jgi:hypothetical protein
VDSRPPGGTGAAAQGAHGPLSDAAKIINTEVAEVAEKKTRFTPVPYSLCVCNLESALKSVGVDLAPQTAWRSVPLFSAGFQEGQR